VSRKSAEAIEKKRVELARSAEERRRVRKRLKGNWLRLQIAELQKVKDLADAGCDFTREHTTEGMASQVTVLFGIQTDLIATMAERFFGSGGNHARAAYS
jgi:hypothetical protein